MNTKELLDKHAYNSYPCNDDCDVWVISEKQMKALLSERDLTIEPKEWIKSDLMPFLEYLYDMDRIRLNIHTPPFETVEMIVDGYIKARIEPRVVLKDNEVHFDDLIKVGGVGLKTRVAHDLISTEIRNGKNIVVIDTNNEYKNIEDFSRRKFPIPLINEQMDYQEIYPKNLNELKLYNKFNKKRKKK